MSHERDMSTEVSSVSTQDPIARLLRVYAQNVMVVVFGLLPLLFIPSGSSPFEYTKILIASGGVLAALILYSLSALRAGGIEFGFSMPIIASWVLALVALCSALLSGDIRDALMGDILTTHTTAFLVLLALIISVWSLIDIEKKTVTRFYMLLAGSTIVLVLYHALRILFGADTLTFSVFTSPTSTPVGTWNDLALFLGLSIILALVALEQLTLNKWGRSLFVVVTVLALCMLAVINFFAVWLVLGFTSLTVLVYTLTKDRMGSGQFTLTKERSTNNIGLGASLVVFVVSVLFIIGGGAIGGLITEKTGISYLEVRPSLSTTLEIARNVYNEHTFFGVGPNKFGDAWRMFKDPAINTTIFWNTDFVAGNGYITTFLVTCGVLGILAWIGFLGTFLVTGIRMLTRGSDQDKMWYFIGVSSFVAGVYLWGMSLVYVPSAVILMLGAVCIGITITADRSLRIGMRKTISLVTNRKTGFIFTFAVIVIIVGSVSGLYTLGTHYVAAREYVTGLMLANSGERDAAVGRFESAYALYQSDVYARRIGEIQFDRLTTLMGITTPTEADRAEFQATLPKALSIAEEARKNDPLEADNWSLVGNLYNVLLSLGIDGTYEKANEALLRARELNPKNPLAALNLAVLEGRKGNHDAARKYIDEAVRLRPNFTEAYAYLAQIEIATGNVAGAIQSTRAIISFEPQNPIRYYQLGMLEAAERNVINAIAAFEQAVALDPNYANARFMLALAYQENGRINEAIAALEQVALLNPDNAEVKDRLNQLKRGEVVSTTPAQNTDTTVVDEPNTVENNDGTVTTNEDPDTNLVTPVNRVPKVENP